MRPTDRHLERGGLTFHILDHGDHGAPAVLLLHGFNQTAHSWDELGEALARDGFRAIALDQRGHGDTSRADDGDYSREAMADDPFQLLDLLGISQVAVVGMSMGAVHATLGAVRHAARVKALVLVDWAPEVEARGVAVIAQVAPLSWATFDEAVEAMHRFNPRRTIDNLRARLTHSLHLEADGRWRWKVDAHGLARHPRFREPATAMWQALQQVAAPTLVVRGADSDLVTPETAERVAAATRGELATIANAGHSVAGDNPQAFHALVAPFLRRNA